MNRRSPVARIVRGMAMLAGLGVLFFLALSLFNLAVTQWKHAQNPVPGSFYSVDGRQMHIFCAGAGSPTVVMESAASASWLAWRRVQPQLAELTRVCSYDRAGHGWSETRPRPRDAENIVRELHSLLEQAGVERPLVFAAHSAGGLYAREYARQFPGEIAGVVLIDSSSPQQVDALPGWRASYERNKRAYPSKLFWEKLRVWSGWERLKGRCQDAPSDEPPGVAGQYDALMCRPAYAGGEDIEFLDFEQSCKQAARLASFGKVPLAVISRDPDAPGQTLSPAERAEEGIWDREQENMKSLSPLSWRVVARGAGHGVHHDRLELVVAELTLLVNYLRGGSPPPFGTTATK